MPKMRRNERINGIYFVWIIGRRNGVWQADGRSNTPAAGRHSLNTRDRAEALRSLRELDLATAVDSGMADRSLLRQPAVDLLPLGDGQARYLAHVGRPPVQGGAAPRTLARYRAVFDKFGRFAADRGVRYWPQVTDRVLTDYGRWLDDEGYAGRTLYLELTTLKQAVG